MKYTNNIFGADASGGVFGPDSPFRGGLSAVTVVTARIALWVAGALSSGIAVFRVVGGIVYFILKLKGRMYRSFRRW